MTAVLLFLVPLLLSAIAVGTSVWMYLAMKSHIAGPAHRKRPALAPPMAGVTAELHELAAILRDPPLSSRPALSPPVIEPPGAALVRKAHALRRTPQSAPAAPAGPAASHLSSTELELYRKFRNPSPPETASAAKETP